VRSALVCKRVGQWVFDILEPADFGMAPIAAVHEANYLAFLKRGRIANGKKKKCPRTGGDEVISNVYVYENNPLRGVLAQAARYLADGSCPVGAHTWRSAYWSAQKRGVAAASANKKGDVVKPTRCCRPPGHHAPTGQSGVVSAI